MAIHIQRCSFNFPDSCSLFTRKRNSFCEIAVEWPRRNNKSEGATSNKSWEIKLGRGTQAPLPHLIGRTSFHTQKNFVLHSDWTSYFSSDVNNILRSSDWLKLICVWTFTTQLTLLECVYLNLQWNQVNNTNGTCHSVLIILPNTCTASSQAFST